MRISVVIPTYNRPDQLSRVLDHLLESDVEGFNEVEVIVVDDGSPQPAEPIVTAKAAVPPFRLLCITQPNSGPAEARNRGLQESRNEIVLFVDDDVLVLPDVLRKHVDAHVRCPGSVVFGPYPYLVPQNETAEYRFLQNLVTEGLAPYSADGDFSRIETVASGNLSIEKNQFGDNLYETGLTIPVAEEYALIDDLRRKAIPIYLGNEIKAWHLQPPTIEDCCKQNYKYGLGIAELAIKRPRVLELEQFRTQYEHNRGAVASDELSIRLKKIVRGLLIKSSIRRTILTITTALKYVRLPDPVLFRVYRSAVAIHAAAGVHDGEKIFSK